MGLQVLFVLISVFYHSSVYAGFETGEPRQNKLENLFAPEPVWSDSPRGPVVWILFVSVFPSGDIVQVSRVWSVPDFSFSMVSKDENASFPFRRGRKLISLTVVGHAWSAVSSVGPARSGVRIDPLQ